MAAPAAPPLATIVHLFEHLSRADLERLHRFYSPQACFKDPFNEVQGVPAIRGVFEHMFNTLEEPRFVVLERVQQGSRIFLTWDFKFRMRRFNTAPQIIHGGSLLTLDAQGRIDQHRDYWDAAEELYEKLPVVGGLMRWLKSRARS